MPLIQIDISNDILKTVLSSVVSERFPPTPERRFADVHVSRIEIADTDDPRWGGELRDRAAEAANLAAADNDAPQWLERDQFPLFRRTKQGATVVSILDVAPLFAFVTLNLRAWSENDASKVPFDSDEITPAHYDGSDASHAKLVFRLSVTVQIDDGKLRVHLHLSLAGAIVDSPAASFMLSLAAISAVLPASVLEVLGDLEHTLDLPDGLVPGSIALTAGDVPTPRIIGFCVAAHGEGGSALRLGLDPFVDEDIAHWRTFLASGVRPSMRAAFDEVAAWIDHRRLAAVVEGLVEAQLPNALDVRAAVHSEDGAIVLRCSVHETEVADLELGHVEATVRHLLSRELEVRHIGAATLLATRGHFAACICTDVQVNDGLAAGLAIFGGGLPFVDALGSFATIAAILGGLEALADDLVDDALADAIAEHCAGEEDGCRQLALDVAPIPVGASAALSLRRVEPDGDGTVVALVMSTLARADARTTAGLDHPGWYPEFEGCRRVGRGMVAPLWIRSTGDLPVTVGALQELAVGNPAILTVRGEPGRKVWVGPQTVAPGATGRVQIHAAVDLAGYAPTAPLWLRVHASHRVWDHDLNSPRPAEAISNGQRALIDRIASSLCGLTLGEQAPWRNQPHTDPVRFRPSDRVWESIGLRVPALAEPATVWMKDRSGHRVVSVNVAGAAHELRATVQRSGAAEHRLPSLSIEAQWANARRSGPVPVGTPSRTLYLQRGAQRLPAPARAIAALANRVAVLSDDRLHVFVGEAGRLRTLAVRETHGFDALVAVPEGWLAIGVEGVAELDASGSTIRNHRLPTSGRVLGIVDGVVYLRDCTGLFELQSTACGLDVRRHEVRGVEGLRIGAQHVWLRRGPLWLRGPQRRAPGADVPSDRPYGDILDLCDVAMRPRADASVLEVFERFETWATVFGDGARPSCSC